MEATEATSLPQLPTAMNPCAASFKPRLSYAATLKQAASQANQGETANMHESMIKASKKLVTGDRHGSESKTTVQSDSFSVQNTQPSIFELPFISNGSHPSSLPPTPNLGSWPVYPCFGNNNIVDLMDHTFMDHVAGENAFSDPSAAFEGAFYPSIPAEFYPLYPNPLQTHRVRQVDPPSLSQILQGGIPEIHGYSEMIWLPCNGQTGGKEPVHSRYGAASTTINGGTLELGVGQRSELSTSHVPSTQHSFHNQVLLQKEPLRPLPSVSENYNPSCVHPAHVMVESEEGKPSDSLVSTLHDTDRGQGDENPRTMDLIDLNKIADVGICFVAAEEATSDENSQYTGNSSNGDSQGTDAPETKKLRLGDGISSALSALKRINKPPANAPKAPAHRRRVRSQAQPRHTSPASAGEIGTWSQSKRWVSEETKERTAYAKLKTQLQYMGADKSPAIPESPAQLAALRLEITKMQSKRLSRDIRQRQREKKEENKGKDNVQLLLMCGKVFKDLLSPICAWNSCFNEHQPDEDSTRGVKWPSMGELKEEGDKKAGQFERCFPLPRINSVASRILQLEGSAALNSDGTVHWEKKAIKHSSHFILSTPEDISTPAPVIEVDQLPLDLQLLIEHIDRMDEESGDEENDGGQKEC